MGYRLTVHREFFSDVAERLWKSGIDAVKELVENSYDADSASSSICASATLPVRCSTTL